MHEGDSWHESLFVIAASPETRPRAEQAAEKLDKSQRSTVRQLHRLESLRELGCYPK
jgi:hypothetical protein